MPSPEAQKGRNGKEHPGILRFARGLPASEPCSAYAGRGSHAVTVLGRKFVKDAEAVGAYYRGAPQRSQKVSQDEN